MEREEVIDYVVRKFRGVRIGNKNKIVINNDVYKVVLKVSDFSPNIDGEVLHKYKDRWFKLVELR